MRSASHRILHAVEEEVQVRVSVPFPWDGLHTAKRAPEAFTPLGAGKKPPVDEARSPLDEDFRLHLREPTPDRHRIMVFDLDAEVDLPASPVLRGARAAKGNGYVVIPHPLTKVGAARVAVVPGRAAGTEGARQPGVVLDQTPMEHL